LQSQFMVPQVALKVWDVDERYAQEPYAQGVSEDAKTFASSLTQPYCGVHSGFEAVNWLDDPSTAMSVALIALRPGAVNSPGPAFGMLVLASPDPQRFQSGLATDFLERIAELASAALSRLRPRERPWTATTRAWASAISNTSGSRSGWPRARSNCMRSTCASWPTTPTLAAWPSLRCRTRTSGAGWRRCTPAAAAAAASR